MVFTDLVPNISPLELLFQMENVNLIQSLPFTKNIIIVLFLPVATADKCCMNIVQILK